MKKNNRMKQVSVGGEMNFGTNENGLEIMDFRSDESGLELKPFNGLCKVQKMRDASVYITRMPKRIQKPPLHRQDHSTVSHSDKTHRYYFIMWMDDKEDFPSMLVKEANEAAAKMSGMFYKN